MISIFRFIELPPVDDTEINLMIARISQSVLHPLLKSVKVR
jgi:hypothetical protein